MTTLLFSLALRIASSAPSAPLGFTLTPEGTKSIRVILSGPAADLPAGPFQGAMALNGSSAEMTVTGTVVHAGDRWQLPVSVRFADVPADWADRFRPDGFSYRLRETGGASREWTGSRTWKDVVLEGGRDMYSEFGALDSVSLTNVSLLSSEAQARVSVLNPFAFPLKIASTEYVLYAEGREVGSGQTQGMLLHPGQKNVLTLPIDVDHGALLAAAGGAVLSGGEVAVHLDGKLVLRLKGGDVAVPFALSGHLSAGS
jgi:LEA14-like dessication related protein